MVLGPRVRGVSVAVTSMSPSVARADVRVARGRGGGLRLGAGVDERSRDHQGDHQDPGLDRDGPHHRAAGALGVPLAGSLHARQERPPVPRRDRDGDQHEPDLDQQQAPVRRVEQGAPRAEDPPGEHRSRGHQRHQHAGRGGGEPGQRLGGGAGLAVEGGPGESQADQAAEPDTAGHEVERVRGDDQRLRAGGAGVAGQGRGDDPRRRPPPAPRPCAGVRAAASRPGPRPARPRPTTAAGTAYSRNGNEVQVLPRVSEPASASSR